MITEGRAEEIRAFLQERAGEMLERSADYAGEDDPPDTGVVTAWLVIAEVAGGDGERWLCWASPPDQATWLTRGMLLEMTGELP